jgi:hypothetical protein
MGAAAIPWAVAAVTAATAIYQGYQESAALRESAKLQEAAGNEAKKVSEENAARIEAEGAEEQRRLEAKQQQEEASARSKAAASGAVYNADDEKPDSLVSVLTSQKTENKRQLDWEMAATKSQSATERRRGEYERQMSYWQAKGLKSQGKAAVKGGWMKAGQAVATAWFAPGVGSTTSAAGPTQLTPTTAGGDLWRGLTA